MIIGHLNARGAVGFGHFNAAPVLRPTLGLIMIGGQSNARGNGDTDLVTVEPALATPYSAVQEMTHVDSTGFEDPFVWSDTGPRDLQPRTAGGEFSAELSLLRRLNEATANAWACGKCAVDSTSIAVHWDPAAAAPTPNLASQFRTYIGTCESTLGASIANGALFWMQCEGDADNATEADDYATNLAGLVAFFRSSYPNLRVIYYRLHTDCTQAFTANMRASQEQYVMDDPLSIMVNVDDLVLTDQSGTFLHFDSDSLVLLGDRFSEHFLGTATLSTLGVEPDAPSYDVASGDHQFKARGTYSDGSMRNLTAAAVWDSDDDGVATVDAAGLVTPVGAGTCNISATMGAVSDSTLVTVTAAAAAPTIVGWGALAHGTANQVPALPAGYAAGDRLYLVTESTVSIAAPTGYTQKATNSAGSNFGQIFECDTETGSETSPTVVLGTSNHLACRLWAVRGADNTTPIDAIESGNSGGTGVTTITYPTVTTTDLNRLIVGLNTWSIDSAGPIVSGYANANLTTGPTEEVDEGTVDGNGGGIAAWSGTVSAAGALGTTSATASTAILWQAFTIAFKP